MSKGEGRSESLMDGKKRLRGEEGFWIGGSASLAKS